jgi:hypothetical protein
MRIPKRMNWTWYPAIHGLLEQSDGQQGQANEKEGDVRERGSPDKSVLEEAGSAYERYVVRVLDTHI